MSDSLFSTHSVTPGKPSRYTMTPGAVPTKEGGIAGLAVDGNKVPYLVHQLLRGQTEAIAAHAAAAAIAGGAIPAADLCEVFREVGKLDVLAAAVAAAMKPPAAATPKK